MAPALIGEDAVRLVVAVASGTPPTAVDRIEQAGPGVWQAEVADLPVEVAQVNEEAAALGVVVLELRRAGPALPRRPAVAVLDENEVLPLTRPASYPAVWARLCATPRWGYRPEQVLAALAVRYVEAPGVETNQVLVVDLADLADHLGSAQAQALGVTPMAFVAEPPTWAVWSYGLARSGRRPYRLDLLRWRIALDPDRTEIVIEERRTDVQSAFYRS